MLPPAKRPCPSCPYRRDVPSGVWVIEEYAKLPLYDGETFEQPPGFFMCHQQDGRPCAGWVACHDMDQSLAFRLAATNMDEQTARAILDYETDVEVFSSGREAAEHGVRDIVKPGPEARQQMDRLLRKTRRRRS